ncbi:diguanylate cyclase [Alteromonadaceae bacterium Bs31]|nr:diguanylate cyclase [Alteromonadaceae bacterium Bs31]
MVETAGGSQSYRDKYLELLDEQERQQKQFVYQLDLMRRTLIHLSGAAQGLDKNLDAAVLLLKDRMRGAAGPQVVEQMEKVQLAVTEFERHRQREHQATADKMRVLLHEFLELKLPSDLREKIRRFSKSLQGSLNQYRSYPRVLSELTLLQQSALNAALNPPTSFFQRLKGGRTLQALNSASEPVVEQKLDLPIEESNLQLADDGPARAEHNVAPSVESYREAERLASRNLQDEEGYEEVAGRIALTLRELVDSIEPNDVIRHRVDLVRSRIERGMDWYALSVTLEDIRDILMQRYLDVDREFSEYLKEVNKELHSIGETIGVALQREDEVEEAANELSAKVHQEVEKIQSSLNSSGDIDILKRSVNEHIAVIQGALSNFKQTRESNDSQSLTSELRKLLEKVETIEHESSKTKELLEEERYRATHDSLTGLPNREAYNERAYHELQRFQRYGRPLSLAICDIDFFKKINDTYGHQAGDRVLKLIARVVSTRLRKVDFVARYGGEEFVILLPETDPKQAKQVLDKIRQAIASAAFRFKDKPVKITISFGIADFMSEDSVESTFSRADKALYQAKSQGRNCCVLSDNAASD